jgi:transcriptional regulator with XRE-family HTH domain
MTNIRDVFSKNLKKFRSARALTQAELAAGTGVSAHYIGVLEAALKFPSAEMVQALAAALDIDPTELFACDIDPEEAARRHRRAAFRETGRNLREAVDSFLDSYIEGKLQDIERDSSN